MWRNLEEDAISIGLSLDYFWSLNPKQYEKHVKVFKEKEEARIKEEDLMNHLLGRYIAFAFHDPQNYPEKPFSEQKHEELEDMTDDEMEKQAKYNTIKMGGVINDDR